MKKKEIEFIYNSDMPKEREGLAVLKSLTKYTITEFDVQKMAMTPRQIAELAHELESEPLAILNEQSVDYDEKFENLSKNDLLEIVHQNMTLLDTPIIREDGVTSFFNSSYSGYAIDMKLNDVEDIK